MNKIRSIACLRTEQLRLSREALASGLRWLGRRLFPKERPSTPCARLSRTFSKKK